MAADSGAPGSAGGQTFTIAIEGCCHGELDNIYGTLQYMEKAQNKKIDVLICCGDFQAVRNQDDLETLACPPKYRAMNDFWKYYSGQKKPPYPTIFIGGNHEAANYLWELYLGGWAAPDIFFLGYAGAVRFGGRRIAGLSGIYNQSHYSLGHYEKPPYDNSSMRSAYHVRDLEVYRLLQLKEHVDVFVSHDWPRGIAQHGDKQALYRRKKHLMQEAEAGILGSAPGEQLLKELQPDYWFAAHMHVKFPALVQHPGGERATRFLALDKCLPGRRFLQLLELPASGPLQLEYDPEWLAVLRTTHNLMNLQRRPRSLPGFGGLRSGARAEDLCYVQEVLQQRGTSAIPGNFAPTAAAYDPSSNRRGQMPTSAVRNPQTEALLHMLGLDYNLDHSAPQQQRQGQQQGQQRHAMGSPAAAGPSTAAEAAAAAAASRNPEEIDLGDEEDEEAAAGGIQYEAAGFSLVNPEEKDVGDEDDEDDGAVGDDTVEDEEDPMFAGTEIQPPLRG